MAMTELSITAASVTLTRGTPGNGIAGETITRGKTLYVDANDENRIKLANSGALVTSKVIGIAISDSIKFEVVQFAVSGNELSLGATLTKGEEYILSNTTDGGIAASGEQAGESAYKTALGVALSTEIFRVAIDNSGYVSAVV